MLKDLLEKDFYFKTTTIFHKLQRNTNIELYVRFLNFFFFTVYFWITDFFQ